MPKKQIQSQPESSDLGPQFFEVQKILQKRATSRGDEYLIRWKNFPNIKDYTWEPLEHLTAVVDLVAQFNAADDEKKKKKDIKEVKMKKKEDEEEQVFQPSRVEIQSKEAEEDKDYEQEQEMDRQMPKKRGRKKGGKNTKPEGKEVYLPKIVYTDYPKRKPGTKKQQSHPEPTRKKYLKQPNSSSPVLIQSSPQPQNHNSSQSQADQSSAQWYLYSPYRLGQICQHYYSQRGLIFLVNINNVEGELITTIPIPDKEMEDINKENVREYLVRILRQMMGGRNEKMNQVEVQWKEVTQ